MITFDLFSSLLIAAAITTILIIRGLHKYFVRPYFLLQRFKKYKGALCLYRPITGTLTELKTSEVKYGDPAYDGKKRVSQNPDLRLVASTLLDRIYVCIHDPDLIKQFLNKETLYTVKFVEFFGNMAEFMKNGLVFTEGESWKRQRKLISQVFHFDYMNSSLPKIRRTANEWINRNIKTSSSLPCVVNVSKELKIYTSTVLWRVMFGEESIVEEKNVSAAVELVLGMLKTITELTMSPLNMIFGPWFFELGLREIDRKYLSDKKKIRDLFYSKFNQLREKINQKSNEQQKTESANFKNLIELLLAQSEGLSDLEIVSQIFTFFFGGTDTTSELLTILHYGLSINPEAQNKLREEVLTHIGKTEDIKYEHISKMEYLNALIKEALRFGSPAIIITWRTATQDFMLNEIEIKKGTVMTTSLNGVGYNPKFFSNPKEFRPERWLEKVDPGTIETSTHLPFSAGNRRCIGEQLALIESKVLLCELVRQFKMELKTPYELKFGFGSVYHAKPDVNVIYTPLA